MTLEHRLIFETTDLDQARDRIGSVYCRHRIDYSGHERHLAVRLHLATLKHLSLSHVTYGAEVAIDAGEPEHCFLIHLINGGGCEMRVGNATVMAGSVTGAISSATLPLRMRWSAGCAHTVLKINRYALERHLGELLQNAVGRPIEFSPELDVASAAGGSYRRTVDFASAELASRQALPSSPLWISYLEQMLMTMLLTILPHNYSARLAAPVSPATPRHVRRAEDYILTNSAQDISIADIAIAAGVSVRTLFEGFKQFRRTTPLAMLRNTRLEHARAELQRACPSTSVTDIALKWGFANGGRFAQSYRARFGELPSQTLRG